MLDPAPPHAGRMAFAGSDVSVRVNDLGSPTLLVTFTHRNGEPGVGFLEAPLNARGLSTVAFLSHAAHWWQTPQMAEAVAAVVASGVLVGRRVILIGCSMGAFAALAWSRALGADEVVAICPQVSADPAVARFDKRWLDERAGLDFVADDMAGGLSRTARVAILSDPSYPPDARHVAMITALRPVDAVVTPFLSHGVAALLLTPETLPGFLAAVIDDYSPRRLRAVVRGARAGSSRYLYRACLHTVKRGRPVGLPRRLAAMGVAVGAREHPKFRALLDQLGV